MRKLCLALVGATAVVACKSSDNTSGVPDQCNPLGGAGCMLPWPSMAYIDADSSSATGFKLDPPLDAMPQNVDGTSIDFTHFGAWDGFSPTGPMLVQFDTGVGSANLPGWMDPDASLAADSPIVVINVDTGDRLPFFAEIDANIPDPSKANLIIRPLAREQPSGHYAVALRNTLVAADGSTALPIPPAFAAMRDGKSYDHPLFSKIAKNADQMFTAFSNAGVDKSDMVLAYDWVTASDAFLQTDLTTMRDTALPAMGSNGENLTFVAMPQTVIPGILDTYLGTFKSPNFLTDGENNDSIIVRDASGKPMLTGMRDANFAALVPDCVMNQPLPRPTIIFGHGLFGSAASYLTNGTVQALAMQYCFVIIAGDFIGLTDRQIQLAPLAVNDLNLGEEITEKLAQSLIDFMSLETIARGPMSKDPAFMYNGQAVIDPTQTYYVGGSLGGIMGNAFMAYDPNITRGVLAVPGGDWSLLFERSNAWSLLQGAAMGSYTNPELYQLNIALLGMYFEPYDPVTTAAHVIKDPLPGVPVKTILMWYAMGDCLVTNLSTEFIAREMGITLLAPAEKVGWGLTPTPGPLTNGINVLNDHPTPLPPDNNVPPATDNGTHSGINEKPAVLREADVFLLSPQQAIQTCGMGSDGSGTPAMCDCATGACN
jgi:pimeloyl-ACP methyl ester carboxylesterase